MTTVDLSTTTHFVLNLPDAAPRREFMESQLAARGLPYEIVEAMRTRPKHVGVALSHLKAIHRAREVGGRPFVILEDDCRLGDDYGGTYELPDDADALYLGVSRFGIEREGEFGWGKLDAVRLEPYDDRYLRVHNMLARHAVLYLSEQFVAGAVDANHQALVGREHTYPGDIGYAMLQSTCLVLTPHTPVTHQDGQYGGHEPATTTLAPPRTGTDDDAGYT